MRLSGLVLRNRSGLLALVFALLVVAPTVSVQIWPRYSSHVMEGGRAAWVESFDRGYFFTARATMDWSPMVQSQQRRDSRKLAVDELTHESTALCDKDVRSWIYRRPRCASWLATLTTAVEPCTVLCTFLI